MRIGIDLGGSKIEGVALDSNGQIVARQRIKTPQGDYQATILAIVNLVATLEQASGQQGSVGIGTPGAISPATGRIKNSNSLCLIGQPLREDLQSVLQRPVRLANDADCFALSEASDGAGAGAQSVFGVILGTGVGGGLVFNGHLVQGPNAIAGEWGHNPLPWAKNEELGGPLCYCGKQGCIETFLSGPALTYWHHYFFHQHLTAQEIVHLAAHNQVAAQHTMQRYENWLARALASVINIFDPEIIVLGGGVSNIQRLYSNVKKLWGEYVFSDEVVTRLLPAKHGDASGVRGAAWLWP